MECMMCTEWENVSLLEMCVQKSTSQPRPFCSPWPRWPPFCTFRELLSMAWKYWLPVVRYGQPITAFRGTPLALVAFTPLCGISSTLGHVQYYIDSIMRGLCSARFQEPKWQELVFCQSSSRLPFSTRSIQKELRLRCSISISLILLVLAQHIVSPLYLSAHLFVPTDRRNDTSWSPLSPLRPALLTPSSILISLHSVGFSLNHLSAI